MTPSTLPAVARWNLYSLGALQGGRVLRPRDPVAAWLLRNHPELAPAEPPVEVLTAIRARTAIIDQAVLEAAGHAVHHDERIALWTLGSALDGRWARLHYALREAVVSVHEVDTPAVIEGKAAMLARSPYGRRFESVQTHALPVAEWAPVRGEAHPVVLLEGLVERLKEEGLVALLDRIHAGGAPVTVHFDLMGLDRGAEPRWSQRALAERGWRVTADVRLVARRSLITAQGDELCSGMVPLRVVSAERV